MASHDHYYVPPQSKWPIIATLGLLVTVYGLATWFNDLKAARPESHGPLLFFIGGLMVAFMLFGWFGAVVKESRAGLYSAQLDRSFRWGMTWFIFSEVMFFVAFFGALFYVRHFSGPWLGARAAKGWRISSGQIFNSPGRCCIPQTLRFIPRLKARSARGDCRYSIPYCWSLPVSPSRWRITP